jgi:hypothetical protein
MFMVQMSLKVIQHHLPTLPDIDQYLLENYQRVLAILGQTTAISNLAKPLSGIFRRVANTLSTL